VHLSRYVCRAKVSAAHRMALDMPIDALDIPALDEETQSEGGYGGVTLALLGGTLYAVGALIVSYATKKKEAGAPGWTDCKFKCWSVLSWCGLNSGGLCVTFAYQSGASIPLMNAIVYSTNLMLNMLLQMSFGLSVYTKTMRTGTLLFALTALLLGDLSPAPYKVELGLLAQPQAVAWTLVFLGLWVGSAVMVRRNSSLPSTSSVKIMAWALHIACWGSCTDNWAKINGTFDPAGTMYWVLFLPYIPTGAFCMVLSVAAMAATDVALYVPANLCLQLVLNVLSGLLFWGEAARIPSMLSYAVGYMICVLAVYISTPEMDLVASWNRSKELRSRSLSKRVARSTFGRSVLALLEKWSREQPPTPQGVKVLKEETRQALEKTLLSGLEKVAFGAEHLVDLALRLWHKADAHYGPSADTVTWIRETPYFREYLSKDPAFGDVLAGLVPEHGGETLPCKQEGKSGAEPAAGVCPPDIEANVVLES